MLCWQDSSLMNSLQSLLSLYLSGSYKQVAHRNFYTQESGGNEDRQEELEFCLLLYETLATSLHSSHQHMIKVRRFRRKNVFLLYVRRQDIIFGLEFVFTHIGDISKISLMSVIKIHYSFYFFLLLSYIKATSMLLPKISKKCTRKGKQRIKIIF